MEENLKFGEITSTIIGCAMKVHSYFGSGFSEVIYQRSLLFELDKNGLQCYTGVAKKVYYHTKCVGKNILDLIVEDKVLVELKAMSDLDGNSYNQVINYLKVFDLEVGLLINFGKQSLEFKRLVNSKKSV